MQCSTLTIYGLIAGFVAACVAVMAGMGVALAAPAPYGAVILAAVILLSVGLYALLVGIEAAIAAYIACRDSAAGGSACGNYPLDHHLGAIRLLVGIAVAAMVGALAVFVIPAIGNLLGGGPLAGAFVALLLAIGIAASLAASVDSYRRCRDQQEFGSTLTGNPPGSTPQGLTSETGSKSRSSRKS